MRVKKLTRDQKIALSKLGLDPDNYRLIRRSEDGLTLLNRETGKPEFVEITRR